MSKKLNNIKKNVVAFGLISATATLSNINHVDANPNLESELDNVLNDYQGENVVIENGISLSYGESLDLSQHPDWELSNENTVNINEAGIVTTKNEGTVFLSQKIGSTVHIIEVYVAENTMNLAKAGQRSSVDRNYYKVFVDAGHGGSDSGASSNGHKEDNINLQIALKVQSKLKAKGIDVKMSRMTDTFISLSERANMANNYGADVFVSIHQNSYSDPSVNGIETYRHSQKSSHHSYVSSIQSDVVSQTGARNRGVKTANFTVLAQTKMPAALLESGYITNPSEAAKLASSSYQDKIATGIADGIESYLKENIQLEGENPPTNPEVINKGVVTTSSLNVRSGYGTSYSVIGSVKKGQEVEIVESKNGWHKIKYNGGYGHVSGSYINIEETSTPTPPPTTPEVIDKGIVTTSSLNVRSGYGTSYSVIGSVKKGQEVEIVESKNGWHKIKYNGGYGHVSGSYINIEETSTPTPPPTTPEVIDKGIVTTSSLNVRSGYGTSYSVIGSVKKGQEVEIVESKNGWYKIKYNGGYGHVSGSYINIEETSTPTPPPTTPEVIDRGRVTANNLNVRSGYGTTHSVIGSLRSGSIVEIVESKNGWHKIKYNGSYGYVSGSYIESIQSNIRKGTVTANSLNVRSGYGTTYSVIGSVKAGTTVEIVESKNGWHKIKFGGGYGYVSGQYIRL